MNHDLGAILCGNAVWFRATLGAGNTGTCVEHLVSRTHRFVKYNFCVLPSYCKDARYLLTILYRRDSLMNRHRFARLVFSENGRSPFTLSLVELLVAVSASISTWLAMYGSLTDSIPFGYYGQNPETYLPLVASFRTHILAAISAISLVRWIRNDVRHFSRLGHCALALQPIFSLSPLVYFCFPFGATMGLGLGIIATFQPVTQHKNMGNLIALPVSIASIILGVLFWSRTTEFWTG